MIFKLTVVRLTALILLLIIAMSKSLLEQLPEIVAKERAWVLPSKESLTNDWISEQHYKQANTRSSFASALSSRID